MKKRIYGLATALTLISTGAMATDVALMNPEERAAFGAEVRTYLLENPEVLEEAQQVLETRKRAAERERDAQMVVDHAETLYADPMSPVVGDPEARFTLVKFTDYNCGYCKATEPEVAAFLEANPDYRLIVKEFPILGTESIIAATFAEAVWRLGGAGAYETASTRLYEAKKEERTAEFFRSLAAELGLDPDRVTEVMGSDEVRQALQRNVDLARDLEITGTPALLFEDVIVRGRIPLQTMEQIRTHLDTR